MYDELVEALRLCVKYGKGADVLANALKAADAIEELTATAESYKRSMEAWADEAARAQEMMPRWIPVTERLPEKNQIVVAHEGKGTWDFGMFRGISASGNPEYWHWKKNTFKRVKWWMPKDGALPEPPKEEEA